MKPTLYSHRKRMKAMLAVMLSFTLLFGLLSSLTANPAQAKSSSRLAIVTEVGGSVTVQSAGASNAYDAYEGMSLNQGDYITTGSDSYVVLSIKDTDDKITIGAYAEVYISDLASSGSGKKSKLKMWAGSMWTSVKKLAGADEFEVETPTSVMGVRGTNVAFGVDPDTGETFAAVASGTVTAESTVDNEEDGSSSEEEGSKTLLSPSQQYRQSTDNKGSSAEDSVSTVDIEELVNRISSKIVEAMVESSNAINEENDEYIRQQEEALDKGEDTTTTRDGATSSLKPKSKEELEKLKSNFKNIVGNVVNTAISSGVVDATKIQEAINKANESAPDDKKLDLSNVKPLDTTAGLDPEKEAKKKEDRERRQQERQAKLEQQKLEIDKLLKELEAALSKLKEEQKRLEDERKAAEQAAKDKAAAELAAKLSAEEKARFEADKKAADQKKAEQAAASASPSATPTPRPSVSPSASPSPSPSGTDTGTNTQIFSFKNHINSASKSSVSLAYVPNSVSNAAYGDIYLEAALPSGVQLNQVTVDDPNVAAVQWSSGNVFMVKAKRYGSTTLRATAPGYSGAIPINVFAVNTLFTSAGMSSDPSPVPLTNISVVINGSGSLYGAELHFGFYNPIVSNSASSDFFDSATSAYVLDKYDSAKFAAMFVPGPDIASNRNADKPIPASGYVTLASFKAVGSPGNFSPNCLFRIMLVAYDGSIVLDYYDPNFNWAS